jgi:hypothetical protein
MCDKKGVTDWLIDCVDEWVSEWVGEWAIEQVDRLHDPESFFEKLRALQAIKDFLAVYGIANVLSSSQSTWQ